MTWTSFFLGWAALLCMSIGNLVLYAATQDRYPKQGPYLAAGFCYAVAIFLALIAGGARMTVSFAFLILGLPLVYLAAVSFVQAFHVATAKPWNPSWPWLASGTAFVGAYACLVYIASGGVR